MMPNPDGSLTEKEQKVIDEFERARKGSGDVAKRNILNPLTGWADAICEMDEREIVCIAGTASNSFSYRHIGHSGG